MADIRGNACLDAGAPKLVIVEACMAHGVVNSTVLLCSTRSISTIH